MIKLRIITRSEEAYTVEQQMRILSELKLLKDIIHSDTETGVKGDRLE